MENIQHIIELFEDNVDPNQYEGDARELIRLARREISLLKKDNKDMITKLEDVCSAVAYTEGSFYHPNAAGTPQYTEPDPHEMVEKAIELKDLEIAVLRAGMVDVHNKAMKTL